MSVESLTENFEQVRVTRDEDFLRFLKASQNADLAFMRDFLSRRPEDLNRPDEFYGAYASHFAARGNNVEALNLLLESGATLGRQTNHGWSEIHYAITNKEMVEALLRHCPALLNQTGASDLSPLMLGAHFENPDIVHLLLNQESIETSLISSAGNNALHFITDQSNANPTIASMLLAKDPSLLNVRNNKEETPLAMAIGSGNVDMALFLLEQNELVIDQKSKNYLALQDETFDVVKEVLEELYPTPSSQTRNPYSVGSLAQAIVSADEAEDGKEEKNDSSNRFFSGGGSR